MKIETYSVASPIKGICKSYAIWGQEGNEMAPLAYFTKPKWISDTDFIKIINSLTLNLPQGYEIKGEL